MSEDKIGKRKTEETKQKMRNGAIGRKMSEEAKNKMSDRKIRSKKINSSSMFFGVHSDKKGIWIAIARINRKQEYLGSFKNEVDAALCYDEYSWNIYKDKNMLNFPENH